MSSSELRIWATIILGLAILSVHSLVGQTGAAESQAGDRGTADSGVVRGEPFSATSYVRVFRTLPGGKLQFVRNVQYPMHLARDSEGRVRLEVVVDPRRECNQLTILVPPPCPVWTVMIFDPTAQTMTHWPEGAMSGHVAAVIRLSSSQVEDVENLTSAIPLEPKNASSDEANITTRNLGEKVIEGVDATGVRTTTVRWVEQHGNKTALTTIHEVWTSVQMKLILRIIDGDPRGEETISGLEHISLQPDPALFQPPAGYAVQSRDQDGRDQNRFADEDIDLLGSWFAGPPSESAPN